MKIFFLLCFLLFSKSWSIGQLLYELKSKDGLKTSYLYGTIHLMPADKFEISSTLKNAIVSSKTLAMEVDLNMDFATKIELIKETMLPEGKTLQDITTPEEFQTIYRYWVENQGKSKRKFKKYARLKPFFFSSMLLQEDIKHSKSYEMEFNKLALKQEMKIMGLESPNAQMQTINTVSYSDQVKMLLDEIKKPQEYDAMLTHYLKEDIEALYEDIIEESEGFPNFVENFLNKRNRQWISILEKQLEKEATFVAVGAGHLPGENGVLNLLKLRGYSLKPIYLNR